MMMDTVYLEYSSNPTGSMSILDMSTISSICSKQLFTAIIHLGFSILHWNDIVIVCNVTAKYFFQKLMLVINYTLPPNFPCLTA